MSSSAYQMWLTHNGGKQKMQLPVHPEIIRVKSGTRNKSVDISGLGEITIMQDRPAVVISFSSFFPATMFQGVQTARLTDPDTLANKIRSWKNSTKPAKFLVTGTSLNMYCTIEEFHCEERGGDVGTIHYSITLKEYREVSVRQISVDSSGTATVPKETETRTDNRVTPSTYTVVAGDCLFNIAQRVLKSSGRYMEIYELNKDKISNPNLIYPGQVLKLPAA